MNRKRSGVASASIDKLNAAARAAGFAMVPVEEPQLELRRTREQAPVATTAAKVAWWSARQSAQSAPAPRIVVRGGGLMDWLGAWSRKATA